MAHYPLRIGTPDGLLFDGEVERVKCRTITGDLAILTGHSNYCTALGMGDAYIRLEDGTERHAACIGGMISMMNNTAHLLATTWEWKEDIDVPRAELSRDNAEKVLADANATQEQKNIAKARLQRALVRIGVAQSE
ncbi:MAG: ATP synthase F1 subunit epsilon [Lachnospiraceae bacterium]|nr:ATP synthase F1 subunit epsilon [Lachnospiraceae bacterium]